MLLVGYRDFLIGHWKLRSKATSGSLPRNRASIENETRSLAATDAFSRVSFRRMDDISTKLLARLSRS